MGITENTNAKHQINEKRRRAAHGVRPRLFFCDNLSKQQQSSALLLVIVYKHKKNNSQGCAALALPLTVVFFVLLAFFKFDVFSQHKFYLL